MQFDIELIGHDRVERKKFRKLVKRGRKFFSLVVCRMPLITQFITFFLCIYFRFRYSESTPHLLRNNEKYLLTHLFVKRSSVCTHEDEIKNLSSETVFENHNSGK